MSELAKIHLIHDFTEFLIEKGYEEVDYDNLTDFEIIIQKDKDTIYYGLPLNELDKVLTRLKISFKEE